MAKLSVSLDELSSAQLVQICLLNDELLDVITHSNNALLERLNALPEIGDDARSTLNEWSSCMNRMMSAAGDAVEQIVIGSKPANFN